MWEFMQIHSRFPILLTSPLFADLPAQAVSGFLDECALRTFQSTAPILRQGDLPEGVFIVAEGKVEISHLSAEGHNSIIAHVGSTQPLGLIETVAGCPCEATVTAFAGSTLVYCPPNIVEAGLKQPTMLRNFARVAAKMLQHDNDFKAVDKFFTAEQRICRYLGQFARDGSVYTQSQSYLANAVGCSRQTVNREIGVLTDLGIIARVESGITVLDHAALCDRIKQVDERAKAGA